MAALFLGTDIAWYVPSMASADQDDSSAVQIEQHEPAFLVRASLNHKNRSYREGDQLTLRVVAEGDSYGSSQKKRDIAMDGIV